jgi:hypothetical protein
MAGQAHKRHVREKQTSAGDGKDESSARIEEAFREEQRKSQPDFRKVPYCDKHLGVQMRFAVSHSLMEYGNASADSNPLRLWRCPRVGCRRSYEPTMFGYFWYSGDMGSGIEPNAAEQPRCNHLERPFMYVGKVGHGRRFLCPLYKCGRQGKTIAASVVDEEVEIPSDPMEGLGKEELKRTIELTVFTSFASASGLGIDAGSPANEDPPRPDIRCTVSGSLHWFEIGQIISPEVASKINPKRRSLEGGFSFDQEIPFVDIVTKKACKNYETHGAPVELVLYFDLHLGSRSAVQRQIEKHAGLLKSLVAEGPFARVWIFDAWKKTIVWSGART